MIFKEIDWIHSNIDKLSPDLKNLALEWYKPVRFAPGFMQTCLKSTRQRVRKVPVIVQIDAEQELISSQNTASKSAGCKVKQELHLINSFTSKVSAKSLEKLVKTEGVKKVWLDGKITAFLDVAAPAVKATAPWSRSITGKGIGVAVIDTGIYKHPDLSGRIVGFKDFIKNKTSAYDDNGHGTHVAGDIASNGSRSASLYKGTAPEANLIGVKVLDKNGSGSLSTVIQGIQWCISNREKLGIRVINLSLGSTALQSYHDDPVCLAVENAWANGIVVCAAAGNAGPGSGTVCSPGIDPKIITVGAIDDKNSLNFKNYKIASYSSRGPTIDNLIKPDVVCPGTNIISLRSPNSTLDKQYSQGRVASDYFSLSGTSMATPICAGIAALMLEANGTLTPDEVKKILMETTRPLPNMAENIQGKGLVDADRSSENNPGQ